MALPGWHLLVLLLVVVVVGAVVIAGAAIAVVVARATRGVREERIARRTAELLRTQDRADG